MPVRLEALQRGCTVTYHGPWPGYEGMEFRVLNPCTASDGDISCAELEILNGKRAGQTIGLPRDKLSLKG